MQEDLTKLKQPKLQDISRPKIVEMLQNFFDEESDPGKVIDDLIEVAIYQLFENDLYQNILDYDNTYAALLSYLRGKNIPYSQVAGNLCNLFLESRPEMKELEVPGGIENKNYKNALISFKKSFEQVLSDYLKSHSIPPKDPRLNDPEALSSDPALSPYIGKVITKNTTFNIVQPINFENDPYIPPFQDLHKSHNMVLNMFRNQSLFNLLITKLESFGYDEITPLDFINTIKELIQETPTELKTKLLYLRSLCADAIIKADGDVQKNLVAEIILLNPDAFKELQKSKKLIE